MSCSCVTDIENRVKAHLVEQGKYKKPVKRVSMNGVVFMLGGAVAVTRTANTLEIELDGQKKLERMSMVHTFCPFCGVKLEKTK